MDRLNGFDPRSLAVAVDALRRGLVVAYPTDTLYGLAADPRSSDAVDRLFALKGRAADKTTPLIAADVEQARRHVRITPLASRLASLFWPGPLTLVLESVGSVDARVLGERSTVAIRVPDQPLAQALARAAEHPITSTSANRSGGAPTAEPDEVARQLPSLDVLLDGGPARGGAASTIVDATGHVPVLLRAGAIAWERVLESLGPASTPPGL
jgi:L-threonylcarbamoyladenylate synthase